MSAPDQSRPSPRTPARTEGDAPARYPWQGKFEQAPHTFTRCVIEQTRWAVRSERDRLRQLHAQTALAALDELRDWVNGEEGARHRAFLERLAGPTAVAFRGDEAAS